MASPGAIISYLDCPSVVTPDIRFSLEARDVDSCDVESRRRHITEYVDYIFGFDMGDVVRAAYLRGREDVAKELRQRGIKATGMEYF